MTAATPAERVIAHCLAAQVHLALAAQQLADARARLARSGR